MNKFLMGTLGLVLLIGSVFAMFSTHKTNPSEEGLKYGSMVCVEKNGELVSCGENTLTDAGKELIEDFLTAAAATTTNVNQIALCNSSNVSGDGGGDGCAQPQTDDTFLEGEYHAAAGCGLERTAGTYTDQGQGNFSYANTFTATCSSLVTNVTAIYNASAGETQAYFAGNNFTSVTLDNNDELTVTWYIWVT